MDGARRPRTAQIGEDALGVEDLGDLRFPLPFMDEHLVDPKDDAHLLVRPANQDHAVGLQALLLAPSQDALFVAVYGR